jgi:AcrR family transcriptional regulator
LRPTLRDQKKLETRDALVRVAADLFGKRGFEAVTIDEIAEAAGVSRRTYFRYFATKEAVVFPHAADRLDRFRAMLARYRDPRDPFAAVRRACLEMAEEFSRHRQAQLAQQHVIESSPTLISHERALDLEWEAAIAEALTRGSNRPARRQASILAGAVMGAIRATLREWYLGEARADPVTLADETLGLVERGMRSARAR